MWREAGVRRGFGKMASGSNATRIARREKSAAVAFIRSGANVSFPARALREGGHPPPARLRIGADARGGDTTSRAGPRGRRRAP